MKKKLTLSKETLRDLTVQDADEVKGGQVSGYGICSRACGTGGCYYTVDCHHSYYYTCKCQGKTYNKKC